MNAFRAATTLAAIVPMMAAAQVTTAKPGPEITKLASQLVGTWSYEGATKAANP